MLWSLRALHACGASASPVSSALDCSSASKAHSNKTGIRPWRTGRSTPRPWFCSASVRPEVAVAFAMLMLPASAVALAAARVALPALALRVATPCGSSAAISPRAASAAPGAGPGAATGACPVDRETLGKMGETGGGGQKYKGVQSCRCACAAPRCCLLQRLTNNFSQAHTSTAEPAQGPQDCCRALGPTRPRATEQDLRRAGRHAQRWARRTCNETEHCRCQQGVQHLRCRRCHGAVRVAPQRLSASQASSCQLESSPGYAESVLAGSGCLAR